MSVPGRLFDSLAILTATWLLLIAGAMGAGGQSLNYSNAISSLNPAGYWPMHELAAAAPGDVETNYGSLGVLGNAFYPDYQINSGAFVRQQSGPLANGADTAVRFTEPVSNSGGSTNSLYVPHTSSLTTLQAPFTIELWYLITNLPTAAFQGDIIGQCNGAKDQGFRVYFQNSGTNSAADSFNILFYNTTTANQAFQVNVGGEPSNSWHQLVFTVDASDNVSGYLDGALNTSNGLNPRQIPAGRYSPDSHDPLTIGNGLGNQRGFNGMISEVAIYTNVITDMGTHYSDATNALASASQYFNDVIADNPILYLRMNSSPYTAPASSTWPVLVNDGQTNGTAVGNGVYNPGTVPGALVGTAYGSYPFGLISSNVTPLSGISSFADAGSAAVYNPTGTEPFTVSAIFRGNPTDTNRAQMIVGHGTNSWELGMAQTGGIVFNSGTNSTSVVATGAGAGDLVSTTTGCDDGNWHWVVAVHNGTTNVLYVDGLANNTNVVGANNAGNSLDAMIGSDPSYTNIPMAWGNIAEPLALGAQFAGQICEVAFFTNALTGAQIQLLAANAGFAFAPYFIQPPLSSETEVVGSALVIPASIGGTGPLSYQWLDVNANTNIATGTTSGSSLDATLSIASVPANWNGDQLELTASNPYGTTNVFVAFTVATAPLFTANLPAQVSLVQGQPYTYSPAAIGVQPLSYQWYNNGAPITGQTNAAYSFFAGSPGTITYDVVASNAYGSTTSVVSTVTIQPPTPMTLTITNSPGYSIPDDFSGLSWEIGQQLPNEDRVIGNIFNPGNTQLITLFQNMNLHHLRIGAGTVDNTNYAMLSDSDIDNLFGFVQAAGLKVIYDGLRLLNGNANTDAITAQYVWQNYGSMVDQFAIGNEPDEYGWSYATYLSTWTSFYDTISPVVPGATFAAPESAGTSWNASFASSEDGSGRVAIFTTHAYWGGQPTVTADEAVSNMLSARWINTLYQNEVNADSTVTADGYPYRFTEMNDYLTGVTNASNAFASALWALDVLHWWAAQGCSGINFHNNEWIPTDTVTLDGNGNFQINPKAYGLRAWDLGGHGRVEPVTISNPNGLNLTAYAVADPANLYVTLINKEYGSGERNAAVALQLNGFEQGSASAMYLTVASGNVEATNGVTLGGASITNNTLWQGQWTALGAVTNGQFTVTVPAASAAVVRLSVAPAGLAVQPLGTSRIQLTWSFGVLQSATNVAGPYNDISNALSPSIVTITNAQEFYRISGD